MLEHPISSGGLCTGLSRGTDGRASVMGPWLIQLGELEGYKPKECSWAPAWYILDPGLVREFRRPQRTGQEPFPGLAQLQHMKRDPSLFYINPFWVLGPIPLPTVFNPAVSSIIHV